MYLLIACCIVHTFRESKHPYYRSNLQDSILGTKEDALCQLLRELVDLRQGSKSFSEKRVRSFSQWLLTSPRHTEAHQS
jgi:hypothetical protein